MSTESPIKGTVYLNAYSVTRHYGGPEEGGWWYDVGEPVASVPFEADDDASMEFEKNRLKRILNWPDNGRSRYSVLGGADLVFAVEDHPAQPYPDRKPHYE